MIVGIGIEHELIDCKVNFSMDTLGNRKRVLYHQTTENLKKCCLNLTKIIVPWSLNGADYSFKKLVEHIRVDGNKSFSKVPIIVLYTDSNIVNYIKFEDLEEDKFFNRLSVIFTQEIDLEKTDKLCPQTYHEYRNRVEEPNKTGSHDKSNFWGPYICLKSLSLVDRGNDKYLKYTSDIVNRLSEEIYYKKLFQKFEGLSIDQHLIDDLTDERNILREILSEGKAKEILCIDDQIDDGWKDAYECIFSISKSIELKFASNEAEAKKIVNSTPDLSLILIDVRLDIEADKGIPVEKLSGVRLAETIRKKIKTIPIIAATASNKSWTLEALLERGINSYWVKASPELIRTNNSGLKNVLDLYKKINVILQWSIQTRHWQDSLYKIASDVKKTPHNKHLVKRFEGKAKSLQALLFRSFSPFSCDLSDGLQINLAFLLIYSCLNDLTEWMCTIKDGKEGECQWFLQGNNDEDLLVERKRSRNSEGREELKWHIQDETHRSDWTFPDTKVVSEILKKKSFKDQDFRSFRSLSKIRNGLPLIHGKIDPSGSTAKTIEKVSPKQIDTLVKLLVELTDHHLTVLKTRIRDE